MYSIEPAHTYSFGRSISSEEIIQLIGNMAAEKWDERWKQGKIPFHLQHVHKLLTEHSDSLINGRKEIRILVPLCGKTKDMKWLADQGHTIIGVEVSELAIRQFFEENNLQFITKHVDSLENVELFQSKDGRIQIYNCNIFDISSDIIGEVDAIWDRGGITAIEPLDMGRYLDVITSNMNAYTRYCLVVVDYDPSVKSDPPFPQLVLRTDIEQSLGARLSIEKIGETSALREILVKKGHKYFNDVLFLLTLKP